MGIGWENGKGANGKRCGYVKILKRNKIVKNTVFKKNIMICIVLVIVSCFKKMMSGLKKILKKQKDVYITHHSGCPMLVGQSLHCTFTILHCTICK